MLLSKYKQHGCVGSNLFSVLLVFKQLTSIPVLVVNVKICTNQGSLKVTGWDTAGSVCELSSPDALGILSL